ncbi:hypothetical protein ACVIQS_002114 [Bradyrhizobium diazoefficiens]
MADRGDREIARIFRDFEVGEDRGGSPGIFAVLAQRALGFAGRAAGVVQRGEIVRAGEAMSAGMASDLDRLQQVDAIARPAPW